MWHTYLLSQLFFIFIWKIWPCFSLPQDVYHDSYVSESLILITVQLNMPGITINSWIILQFRYNQQFDIYNEIHQIDNWGTLQNYRSRNNAMNGATFCIYLSKLWWPLSHDMQLILTLFVPQFAQFDWQII